MRTLVDLPDDDLLLLSRLSKQGKVPRAELVRRAVATYLHPHRLAEVVDAFGLWADEPEDGLVYQDSVRKEW